jgi:hypothetical protein
MLPGLPVGPAHGATGWGQGGTTALGEAVWHSLHCIAGGLWLEIYADGVGLVVTGPHGSLV